MKLQRAHRRDGLEMMMEAGNAHSEFARDMIPRGGEAAGKLVERRADPADLRAMGEPARRTPGEQVASPQGRC